MSADDELLDLVDNLNDIDNSSSDAETNATTISDGNGGRIELAEDEERVRRVVIAGPETKIIRHVKLAKDKPVLTIKVKREIIDEKN